MKIKELILKYYPQFIVIYTIWLLYLLFFLSERNAPTEPFAIKYIPFDTIYNYIKFVWPYSIFKFSENILGNILLFIPYGFLCILFPKLNRFLWLFLSFFAVINLIEFSQYYFNRGYADIDDVILNTFGCLMGFFIYKRLFSKDSISHK